ncbi:unnamed protein product [Adineta ricciae]|uniref:Hcy-binding domain-containing protein n=1 Tax=Adineta ricciae TaxID=249248 RepID=A0A815D2U0_ADIRI|nr:unnamed protein product [Adineta ricciae]
MNFADLKNKIILIDGGLGTTLHEYGHDTLADPLWSGKVLVKRPDQLVKVHRAFVQAGCDIILSATYQISIDNLMKCCEMSHEQAEETIFNSVTLARQAISEEKAQCFVAASVGPYGAVLCDGSEFNGWYTDSMTIEQFKDWHRPRLAVLARAEPDLIAFETIPSKKEAEALAELLKEYPNLKGWLSFNCQNASTTALGEPIEEAAVSACLKSPDQIIAVGVNCVHPANVVPLIEKLRPLNRDLVAYPNSGVIWDSEKCIFNNQGQALTSYIRSYIDAGVKYIGGCCNVNPNEISAMRHVIDEYLSKKKL